MPGMTSVWHSGMGQQLFWAGKLGNGSSMGSPNGAAGNGQVYGQQQYAHDGADAQTHGPPLAGVGLDGRLSKHTEQPAGSRGGPEVGNPD